MVVARVLDAKAVASTEAVAPGVVLRVEAKAAVMRAADAREEAITAAGARVVAWMGVATMVAAVTELDAKAEAMREAMREAEEREVARRAGP